LDRMIRLGYCMPKRISRASNLKEDTQKYLVVLSWSGCWTDSLLAQLSSDPAAAPPSTPALSAKLAALSREERRRARTLEARIESLGRQLASLRTAATSASLAAGRPAQGGAAPKVRARPPSRGAHATARSRHTPWPLRTPSAPRPDPARTPARSRRRCPRERRCQRRRRTGAASERVRH
jgi:hypothetical protein